jgi:hypothetical protein
MSRLARFDYLAPIEIVDAPEAPTAARSTAVKTSEGYLIVDAYIARDGLLMYSDGVDSWWEYRPRDQLEAAAASWDGSPITNEHPPSMVDAQTWRSVARGVLMGPPVLEDVDGVAYLRGKFKITDSDLVMDVVDGKRETSIGFTSEVLPDAGSFNGSAYDAVQTNLLGNHVAVVESGRAGPAVRILMDGAAVQVPPMEAPMKPTNQKPAKAIKVDAKTFELTAKHDPKEPRKDEMGAPVEYVSITGPDGQSVSVPTWVAAYIEEQQAFIEAQKAKGNMPEEPVASAAPEPPSMPEPPASPAPDAAGEPLPAAPSGPPAAPSPDDEEKDAMEPDEEKDSAEAVSRRRARLERLAARCGIEDAALDAAESCDAVARLIVAQRFPKQVETSAKLRGDALDAFVDAALSLPTSSDEPKNDNATPANPWTQPTPQPIGPSVDKSVASFMQRQGY